jgi:hypothetical protein
LNPQPLDPKSSALSIELRAQRTMYDVVENLYPPIFLAGPTLRSEV